MNLETRISRLEKSLNSKNPALSYEMFIADPGETKEACLKRHGISDNDHGLKIVVIHFCDQANEFLVAEQAKSETQAQPDPEDEIRHLIAELQSEGVTLDEDPDLCRQPDPPAGLNLHPIRFDKILPWRRR